MRNEKGRLFPLFVDISERKILIVGGGTIAARRVEILLEFGPEIRVVAPEISGELEKLSLAGKISLERRKYQERDLDEAALVLAATNDAILNEEIYAACKNRKIPVNVCSDRALCDFQFPGIVLKEELTVGISASGRNHSRAKQARIAIEECLRGKKLYE